MLNVVRPRTLWTATWAVAALTATAGAQSTLHVPAQYATIQAAINAAVSGDNVEVADGTYVGAGNKNLTFSGKAITVRSANGAAACVIDCQNSGRAASFNAGDTAVFDGFTITNGNAFSGGGIACQNGATPTIINCTITNCFAANSGGAIFCFNSSPLIENCLISQNDADALVAGGGIALSGSSPTITGCTLVANTAGVGTYGGGIVLTSGSNPTITHCTFSMNSARRGGGIALTGVASGSADVRNCLFIGNQATGAGHGGGALYCDSGSMSAVNCTMTGNQAISGASGGSLLAFNATPVTFTNCISWGNTPAEIAPGGANLTATYSDIAGGWPGTGNIDADPLFTNAGTGDYTLSPGSPCIDVGDDAAAPGADDLAGEPRIVGVHVDMGAFEFGVFDSDADGLSDTDEGLLGTNPYDADTDDDGLLDGTEVDTAAGTGCPDPLAADSDGDTLLDGAEVGAGSDPCNADSDNDAIPDNIDPYPTDPGGTTSFVEDGLRGLADTILGLDLSLFAGPNNNANKGRRNALANRANAAANAVADGDYAEAIDILRDLQKFVDGIQPPPEWMIACAERDAVYDTAEALILLLEYLM